MRKITLSAVRIPGLALELIKTAFEHELVGHSIYVEHFEEMIANYVGARYCVAVSNGTMADAVAVAALKESLKIEKVIVPALTFIAQPNSVRYNNLEVVFADVTEDWLIDLDRYFEDYYPNIRTLLFATDLMGRIFEPQQLHGLPMIEDACEAFGSKLNGKFAGTFGLMGTYSFFPSHTISTGEGGAIVTDSIEFAHLCQRIRAHGSGALNPMDKFTFPYFGFNARITTMQACLGIALMEEVEIDVGKRREIFRLMGKKIGGFSEKKGEEIVPHGYPLGFVSEELRDSAMQFILDAGIECRKLFSCIPKDEKQYVQSRKFPVAEHISHTHLYLPCHQNLVPEDVEYMAEIVDGLRGRIK